MKGRIFHLTLQDTLADDRAGRRLARLLKYSLRHYGFRNIECFEQQEAMKAPQNASGPKSALQSALGDLYAPVRLGRGEKVNRPDRETDSTKLEPPFSTGPLADLSRPDKNK